MVLMLNAHLGLKSSPSSPLSINDILHDINKELAPTFPVVSALRPPSVLSASFYMDMDIASTVLEAKGMYVRVFVTC